MRPSLKTKPERQRSIARKKSLLPRQRQSPHTPLCARRQTRPIRRRKKSRMLPVSTVITSHACTGSPTSFPRPCRGRTPLTVMKVVLCSRTHCLVHTHNSLRLSLPDSAGTTALFGCSLTHAGFQRIAASQHQHECSQVPWLRRVCLDRRHQELVRAPCRLRSAVLRGATHLGLLPRLGRSVRRRVRVSLGLHDLSSLAGFAMTVFRSIMWIAPVALWLIVEATAQTTTLWMAFLGLSVVFPSTGDNVHQKPQGTHWYCRPWVASAMGAQSCSGVHLDSVRPSIESPCHFMAVVGLETTAMRSL